jgi:hypothetical protein
MTRPVFDAALKSITASPQGSMLKNIGAKKDSPVGLSFFNAERKVQN